MTMEVYTLVGSSGTGKSFHAMELCKNLGIEAVIDDGLFIYKNRVIEGISAKKAATKIGATKAAIFFDDAMKEPVRLAIKEKNPASVLILGTSRGMVEKIAERLELPFPSWDSPNHIEIESITTEEERATAREQRDIYGKHIIPAPSLQLKRNFAGYFLDPLRIFRGKDQGAATERTVVRPTFSYMGEYYVADSVIDDIAKCVAEATEGIRRVIFLGQTPSPEAYQLSVVVAIEKDFSLWKTMERYQKSLMKAVEEMTAFNVVTVDVEVRNVG